MLSVLCYLYRLVGLFGCLRSFTSSFAALPCTLTAIFLLLFRRHFLELVVFSARHDVARPVFFEKSRIWCSGTEPDSAAIHGCHRGSPSDYAELFLDEVELRLHQVSLDREHLVVVALFVFVLTAHLELGHLDHFLLEIRFVLHNSPLVCLVRRARSPFR